MPLANRIAGRLKGKTTSPLRRLAVLVTVLVTALFATTSIAAPASQAETRVWAFFFASGECVGADGLEVRGTHQGNEVAGYDFASDDTVAARGTAQGVKTPYGTALQEATPAAQTAMAEARAGGTVYRQGSFGVQETTGAQFWSPANPASTPNYASGVGMSGGAATPNWVMGGTVRPGAAAVSRSAPGLGTNVGGKIEIVVQPGGVCGTWFCMP